MNHQHWIIERHPDACYTQITPSEIIALNPDEQLFYHLNESAADLWLSLETPKTVLELTQRLAQKYSDSVCEYEQDVIEWIDTTKQNGLLIVTHELK